MTVRRIAGGTTDVSVVIRIIDSTDGTPETGVVFNSAGIDLWYRREGAASVDITEATLSALTDAHADGGFLHINDGWYRLDLPDAAIAAGVAGVQIGGTVTGMVVLAPYVELDATIATLTVLDEDTTTIDLDATIRAAVGMSSANLDTQISGVQSDTDNIQTRLPAALVSGRMSADVGSISGSTTAADTLEDMMDDTITEGAAVTGTLTTTAMSTNLTSTRNDHYKGLVLTWTSGVLLGEATTTLTYDGSTKILTYIATTIAPANGDTFALR